ncbi:MAG TPA: GNAT family N-acetyltransferase [Streptosporangiaceae bacterium]|nr:GNAT family N-acetyltransferase [Streptosporangiaceae bacterium]
MTGLTEPKRHLASRAWRQAEDASRASGVQIRELTEMSDLIRLCALVDDIWHPNPSNPPVTAELLRALAHAGNYVAGAFAGDQLVGACAGFFSPPATHAMHSHIAGVSLSLLGKHVGFALKLHQRAWALDRDVTTITWTFDPLVCRNAYFNIVKLAALPARYLPDFYGEMDDVINGGDDSDRLLVHWRLAADSVDSVWQGASPGADATVLRAAGAWVALDADAGGRPVIGDADPGNGTVLVRVPSDIETMRRHDRAAARGWRRALRQVLGGLMTDGGQVTGFDRSGWYVVQRGAGAAASLHSAPSPR